MRTFPRSILALMLFGSFLGSSVAAAITDLTPGAGYVASVEALAQARIVTGRSDSDGKYTGLFRPSEAVTRAEMLKMSLLGAKLSFPAARVPSNVSAQGTWASGYVSAAEIRRFGVFRDNKLDVFQPASRGEVAQTLSEAFRNSPQSARIGISKGETGTMTRGEFAIVLARLLPFAPATSTALPVVTQATSSAPAGTQSSSSSVAPVILPPTVVEPVAPVPTMTNATHRVVASSANLRSGSSMEYRVVKILFHGELLILLSQQEAWAEVQLSDGTKGFLILSSIARLQPDTTPAASSGISGVITGPVNVRSRPDLTSTAIDSFPAGTTVIILDQSSQIWLRIRLPDGREGYVTRKFVKIGQ